MAAARLKLATSLIGKGGALPGRNATPGPRRGGGRLVPLSIAITATLPAAAELSACSNIASPQMSGGFGGGCKAAARGRQGRCWLRNRPWPPPRPSDCPMGHLSHTCLRRARVPLRPHVALGTRKYIPLREQKSQFPVNIKREACD